MTHPLPPFPQVEPVNGWNPSWTALLIPPPPLSQVEPVNGWNPSWTAPLIAAVVIIAVIISLLLFTALILHDSQKELLDKTMVGP